MNSPPVSYGDITEHRLPTFTEPGCLDSADLDDTAKPVDDKRRKRLVLDILGNDQSGLPGWSPVLFRSGSRSAKIRDLLFMR